ncbi:hypothetical protein [Fodinicola feengrottensis]|uniref:hypothetical protein n=1 Tax=Fodinicola feengrottensis TaxID=435914 RepID=UPI0024435C3C|nr:hypothetical protein [Fodinicola feengrottensis]
MAFVLAVTAASVFGLMVGVEFAVAFVINPIMLRLPFGAARRSSRELTVRACWGGARCPSGTSVP